EVTACELCLCFISMGFAWPHAVVACRRIREANPKKTEDTKIDTSAVAAEAAAQEAAALGPQLCVILALADTPGHAYVWQNAVFRVLALVDDVRVGGCGLRAVSAEGRGRGAAPGDRRVRDVPRAGRGGGHLAR
ncbi:unnamed protein product, partial [Prorocentrum cordatum]